MKTAMIFSAGRGERLKPITNTRPKALCTIQRTPLIEYHIVNLAAAGFERIIINHAYLGGQIRQYLGTGERWGVKIFYAPEPPGGLETGGALVNAKLLLGDELFVTINADIYTDYPFKMLALNGPHLGHLILVEKPDYRATGDFGLTSQGKLTNDRLYTYSGMACFHPDFIKAQLPGRFSLTPLLRHYIDKQKIAGELYHGQWEDIGTMDRLNRLNQVNDDAEYDDRSSSQVK